MGVSREISELALNHKMRGLDAIYDVRDDIPERRKALEIWAHFVANCCEATGVLEVGKTPAAAKTADEKNLRVRLKSQCRQECIDLPLETRPVVVHQRHTPDALQIGDDN
jgi:hypothetical protein